MDASVQSRSDKRYALQLRALSLQGKAPPTVDCDAMRRAAEHFHRRTDQFGVEDFQSMLKPAVDRSLPDVRTYDEVDRLVRQSRAQDDLDPSLHAAPGHAVLDAFGWWQLHPHLRLKVGVYNLADRRYWRHASVHGCPQTPPHVGFYTQPASQPARNASVALQRRF